eukprot:37309_1
MPNFVILRSPLTSPKSSPRKCDSPRPPRSKGNLSTVPDLLPCSGEQISYMQFLIVQCSSSGEPVDQLVAALRQDLTAPLRAPSSPQAQPSRKLSAAEKQSELKRLPTVVCIAIIGTDGDNVLESFAQSHHKSDDGGFEATFDGIPFNLEISLFPSVSSASAALDSADLNAAILMMRADSDDFDFAQEVTLAVDGVRSQFGDCTHILIAGVREQLRSASFSSDSLSSTETYSDGTLRKKISCSVGAATYYEVCCSRGLSQTNGVNGLLADAAHGGMAFQSKRNNNRWLSVFRGNF